jgi:hypothetical protein
VDASGIETPGLGSSRRLGFGRPGRALISRPIVGLGSGRPGRPLPTGAVAPGGVPRRPGRPFAGRAISPSPLAASRLAPATTTVGATTCATIGTTTCATIGTTTCATIGTTPIGATPPRARVTVPPRRPRAAVGPVTPVIGSGRQAGRHA